jgi:glycosyltransferase involved in cell wall biosynthesis
MALSVSVITPSYNQGAFLAETVQSVLAQADEDTEYFVADGASTDDSCEILRRYDGQLKWVSEPDRGQAHAVNKGIAATSGEIIGWLNSDDVYAPGALQRVRDVFQAEPTVDVVYGQANLIDADGNVVGAYPVEPISPRRMRDTCTLCQPAVFFRRSVVDRFGPLDEELQFCMDYEYWLRLSTGGAQFHLTDRVLACSRVHEDTKTLARRSEAYREACRMLRSRLGHTPGRWLFGYAAAQAEEKGYSRSRPLRLFLASAWRAARADLYLHGRPTTRWWEGLVDCVRRFGPRPRSDQPDTDS